MTLDKQKIVVILKADHKALQELLLGLGTSIIEKPWSEGEVRVLMK